MHLAAALGKRRSNNPTPTCFDMLTIYIDIDFPCRGFSNSVSQHPPWTFTIFLSPNWVLDFVLYFISFVHVNDYKNCQLKMKWKSNGADSFTSTHSCEHDAWWEQNGGVVRKLKTDTVNRKGHPTYFHQYTPSKQIDWQCETGPSIVPYWDHNIILPLFGWISQCYHHKSNKG